MLGVATVVAVGAGIAIALPNSHSSSTPPSAAAVEPRPIASQPQEAQPGETRPEGMRPAGGSESLPAPGDEEQPSPAVSAPVDSGSGAPDDSASEAARRRAERGARNALEERANRTSRPDTQAPAAESPRKRGKGKGSAEFVLPVDSYTITSWFGDSGELWSSGRHTGLDFAAAKGTPVRAVHGGTVTKVTSGGPLGNHTELRLADGTVLTFNHQATVSVKPGQTVRAGDVIGTVGATGNTTGPHLHLEVHLPDGTVIDPEKWLASEGLTA